MSTHLLPIPLIVVCRDCVGKTRTFTAGCIKCLILLALELICKSIQLKKISFDYRLLCINIQNAKNKRSQLLLTMCFMPMTHFKYSVFVSNTFLWREEIKPMHKYFSSWWSLASLQGSRQTHSPKNRNASKSILSPGPGSQYEHEYAGRDCAT